MIFGCGQFTKTFLLVHFILTLVQFRALSQVTVKTIREADPGDKTRVFEFPQVVNPANPLISKKINDYLIRSFLDLERKDIKKSIFENCWRKEDAITPLSDIRFDKLCDTRNILSLSISAEGCGAYCEYFTRYYSFHTKTGQHISIDSLFTKKGLQLLLDSINLMRKEEIDGAIANLNKTFGNEKATDEDRENSAFAINLYNECKNSDYKTLTDESFYITTTAVHIILERCLPHVIRSLDEIDTFEFTFSFEYWKPYLTAYTVKILK